MGVLDAVKNLGTELGKAATSAAATAKDKAGKVIAEATPAVSGVLDKAKAGAESALVAGQNAVAGAATKVADAVRPTEKK